MPTRTKVPARREVRAGTFCGGLAGGHSIDDPEPKYGMAVTGTADPARLLRIDTGNPACRCH
jgi:selenide,water dikinase